MFGALEVCYIGVLNIFFVALDCQWVSEDTKKINMNRDFPDQGAPCASLTVRIVLPCASPVCARGTLLP